ncbi:MAG: GspH/FimT family pseudopilin [Cyanobacteriota bacterium]|nr:GspH/FimT family pseudopilin [Cyanobacteriota bacterium]
MTPLTPPVRRRSDSHSFTLVETMLAAAALLILTSLLMRSMFHFNEQRKLRTAAAELVGYLQVARSVANGSSEPCFIALSQEQGGIFAPDPTAAKNSCEAGKISTSLRLAALSGSRNLRAAVIPNSGSFPLRFNPEGTVRNGVTVLITSTDTPLGGWCVEVQAPVAIMRTGWRAANADSCNYLVEQ